MAKIQHQLEEYGFDTKPLRVYSPSDFPKIHARLKGYWTEGRFDREKFLFDCGAVTEKGAVVVENFHYVKNKVGEDHGVCDTPTRYDRALHLLGWYLPESGNYPKLDIRNVGKQLEDAMKFEVQPVTDEPF